MPKTSGGGNQKRRKKQRATDSTGREMQLKDEGQEYAQVTKILGGDHVQGQCFDGQTRLCRIRGAMRRGAANRIYEGDIILLGLRDYQDTKADVILRYTAEDARRLKAMGELPSCTNVNGLESLEHQLSGGGGGATGAAGPSEVLVDFDWASI
jgi:translation initiation factor 1A